MATIRNRVKERLAAGEMALGIGIRQARTPDIAKAMKTSGFDWLFLDMEHSAFGVDTVTSLAVATQDAGLTPIARVPGPEHYHATRLLDCGVQGIVLPHCDTAEDAARVVANTKYPPLGHRSVGGPVPQLDFAPVPMAEMTKAVNESTLTIALIESLKAVENCEKIAATSGIDALLIGTSDLCMDMGMPGQVGDPKIADIYNRVIAAARSNGKHPGMGGVYDPALMQKYVGLGMRLILCGSDLSLLMLAGKQRTDMLRAIKA